MKTSTNLKRRRDSGDSDKEGEKTKCKNISSTPKLEKQLDKKKKKQKKKKKKKKPSNLWLFNPSDQHKTCNLNLQHNSCNLIQNIPSPTYAK